MFLCSLLRKKDVFEPIGIEVHNPDPEELGNFFDYSNFVLLCWFYVYILCSDLVSFFLSSLLDDKLKVVHNSNR